MDVDGAMDQPGVKIDALSTEERLDLLERVWESLSRSPADLPVTPAQRDELDRRSDELDQDLAAGRPLGVPWDEVMRQLRARR
jgi:putative addiction module component (TIGR02574 family)